MSEQEKIEMIMTVLNESGGALEDKLSVYLKMAEREILSWRYGGSGKKVSEMPSEYEMTQIYAVIAGYSMSGAENQVTHSENGISRTFAYSDMLKYIRANVIPYCGVL